MRQPARLQQVVARGKKDTCPVPGTAPAQAWLCRAVPCHLPGRSAAFLLAAPAALHQFRAGSSAGEGRGTDCQAGQLHHHLPRAAGTELPVWAAPVPHPCAPEPQHLPGKLGTQSAGGREQGSLPCPCPLHALSQGRAGLPQAQAGPWVRQPSPALGCCLAALGAAGAHPVPMLPLFPQVCPCFQGAAVLGHRCSKAHHFVMLGRLVGHLTLCCTCEDKGTTCEAAEALFHLHTFILQQRSKRSPDGLGAPRHGQPGTTLLGKRKPDATCLPACGLKSHFPLPLLAIALDPPWVSAPQTCLAALFPCQWLFSPMLSDCTSSSAPSL